jgi:hypothetical protein
MTSLAAMRAGALAFCATLAFALLAPAVALGADPTFGPPSVRAVLGEPLTFTSTIDGATDVASVDVVIHLLGNPTSVIVNAGTQINNV